MKPHTLPSTIRIGPLVYTFMREASMSSRNRWGETDNNLREIRFGKDTDPERMSITVLHELMHAVWNIYGSDELFKANEPEEELVAAMAMGLAQVLIDLDLWPKAIRLNGEG